VRSVILFISTMEKAGSIQGLQAHFIMKYPICSSSAHLRVLCGKSYSTGALFMVHATFFRTTGLFSPEMELFGEIDRFRTGENSCV